MREVLLLPNGEKEYVVGKYNLPGRNTGRLLVCDSGNCYNLLRGMSWFLFDAKEKGIELTNRRQLVEAATTAARESFQSIYDEVVKSGCATLTSSQILKGGKK